MSAFLLGIGFRADMGTCARKLVLLKLIDACEDDGTRIFPAIATIARAAQCSTRQVQRELQAFRDAGLIRLVKEGGKGPRSTNEYALDLDLLQRLGREGWAVVVGDGEKAKGDTVSPLDGAEKGDTGDAERVTPETDKGDIACHPTPPDPSLDPSVEREGAGARADENSDDPAKFEKRVKKLAADLDWPGWANSSTAWSVAQFAKLTDAERAEAERLASAYRSMTGRKALSLGTYFAERKWTDVPDPAEAPPEPLAAPPFGPVWSGMRMRRLLSPAEPSPAPTSAFIAQLIAQDDAAGRAERMRRQVQFGWPSVNRMHEAAEQRRGVTVAPELEWIAGLTEFVPIGTETWEAWRVEHELRGWPWLPDPGGMRGAYFPKGGPLGLAEFEAAVKTGDEETQNDGGRSQAA
mgnify:CR=1 FL=1